MIWSNLLSILKWKFSWILFLVIFFWRNKGPTEVRHYCLGPLRTSRRPCFRGFRSICWRRWCFAKFFFYSENFRASVDENYSKKRYFFGREYFNGGNKLHELCITIIKIVAKSVFGYLLAPPKHTRHFLILIAKIVRYGRTCRAPHPVLVPSPSVTRHTPSLKLSAWARSSFFPRDSSTANVHAGKIIHDIENLSGHRKHRANVFSSILKVRLGVRGNSP